MDELCTACLCAGRKLSFIGETGSYHLYSQILNEIPVYDFSEVCVRVCWECRALLRRFREFKLLVKRSYSGLLQQLHQNSPPLLSALERQPRLCTQSLVSCMFPEVTVKDEPGDEAVSIVMEDVAVEQEVDQLDSKPPKLEDGGELIELEPQAELVPEQEPKQKKVKKKTVKKTNKKTVKKLKTKKKLEEKKIKTKKKEDARSVSSEDSRLFICDDRSDGSIGDDADEPDENVIPKEIVPIVDVKETKEKIIVLKGVRRKKEDVKVEDKIDVEISRDEVKQPPLAREREAKPDREPEMLGDKPKCAECGKVFSSKKTYRYHLNVLHKGQNRYPCPRCGKVYQWKSNLGRHMRTHKARDNGELYCEMCDKRFASVATYRQHLRVSRQHVSESEFNFMCNECGKKFVNKTRLRDHVDWDHLHNIKFRCQLCNKPFKCHTSLYVHMQNVHRNKSKENLCHICGKSYQNAAKLKYHIVAMHTSETPYQCAQCSAAFGWYSSLYRHVREVHYKMKVQPKKIRKAKRNEPLPLLPPHEMPPPPPPPHMRAEPL